MTSKAPVVVTVLGLAGATAVAAYFTYNPDKARKLADAVLEGIENTANKVIDNAGDWVENTVMPKARDLLVSAGMLDDNPRR